METAGNPLLSLGFEIPFDRIRPEHVEPGITELIAGAKASIEAVAHRSEPRTYDDVLGVLDRATERLDLAMTVVEHLESVTTTPALRAAFNAVQPEASAFYASIPLNAELWNALKSYGESEDAKRLTGPKKRYLEKTLEEFRRQGADLDDAGKAKLDENTRALAEVTTKFGQNVLDSTSGFELWVEDEAKLAGLPDSARQAARQAAQEKGKDGYRFTLHAPSLIPVMTYLDNASIREQLHRAYNTRATVGDVDNRPMILRILELRRERARILGYANFADLVLEDRMAHDAAQARAFVDDLSARSMSAFARENDELAAFRKMNGGGAEEMAPWDVGYWAEKERMALHDFDEEALRPYFPLPRVMEGLFETTRRLYGVRITKNDRLPTWHPDVTCYDIADADGAFLGSFYADLFPRDDKRGGAWMNGLISGVLAGERVSPHLGLICGNFTRPMNGRPALLTHDEVQTVFHEFGHLLHHMLSRVEVRSLSGTNVAWDFVELPSQIMENWCWERQALDLFARHFETGDAIPEDMFQKMTRARTHRAAAAMMRQLGFATVDLAMHLDYDAAKDGDVVDYARDVMQRFSPARFYDGYAFVAGFTHLFSHAVGYASGYYSYKWAEVLDADAFSLFKERGVFSPEVGRAFRENVLARGNGEDPMALFQRFRGRAPALEPLLERSGLLAPQSGAGVHVDG